LPSRVSRSVAAHLEEPREWIHGVYLSNAELLREQRPVTVTVLPGADGGIVSGGAIARH
jgi:hypothetical protein